MYDRSFPEVDTVPRHRNEFTTNRSKPATPAAVQLNGKRVKVNLYRRGIFRSSVIGVCRVSPLGVSISAETALTQGRLCLSHYELTPRDVAAMRSLKSPEADFELQLELDCIEWQERVEKLPLPRATSSISRKRSWHHHLRNAESPGSGEP